MRLSVLISSIFIPFFAYLLYAQLHFVATSYAQSPISSPVSAPVSVPVSVPIFTPLPSPVSSPVLTRVPVKLFKISFNALFNLHKINSYEGTPISIYDIYGNGFNLNPYLNKVYFGGELIDQNKYVVSANGKKLTFYLYPTSWRKMNQYYDLSVEAPGWKSNINQIYITTPVSLYSYTIPSETRKTATINGNNFGNRKGNVSVYNVSGQYIDGVSINYWSNTKIIFTIPTLSAGDYYFEVISTYLKTTDGDEKGIYRSSRVIFTIPKPIIVNDFTKKANGGISITGSGFGSSKGYVVLRLGAWPLAIVPTTWSSTSIDIPPLPTYLGFLYKGKKNVEISLYTFTPATKITRVGFTSFPK